MEATTLPWLNAVAGTVASTATLLLLVVNGAFALGVVVGRDRRFVNRWTKPLVVTDAALLLAAVGTSGGVGLRSSLVSRASSSWRRFPPS